MTNNIEKLYELAGFYPHCKSNECGLDYCVNSSGCGYAYYPPFTPEKQLKLENYLIIMRLSELLNITFDGNDYIYTFHLDIPEIDLSQFEESDITENPWTGQLWIKSLGKPVDFYNESFKGSGKTREQALSGLLIELWNDLTHEQKKEVKEILE